MAKILSIAILSMVIAITNARSIPQDYNTNEVSPTKDPKQLSPLLQIPVSSAVSNVNAFLSSPLIQMILTNETIQTVLRDPMVQGVLNNPIVQMVLRDPIIQNIISNPNPRGLSLLQWAFGTMSRFLAPVQEIRRVLRPRPPPPPVSLPPPTYAQPSLVQTVLGGLDGIISVVQAYMNNGNRYTSIRN